MLHQIRNINFIVFFFKLRKLINWIKKFSSSPFWYVKIWKFSLNPQELFFEFHQNYGRWSIIISWNELLCKKESNDFVLAFFCRENLERSNYSFFWHKNTLFTLFSHYRNFLWTRYKKTFLTFVSIKISRSLIKRK